MKHFYFLFTCFSLLIFTACGKATVESEQKAWAANLQTIERFSGEYPAFKTVFAEVKTKATDAMKAAESISGEEEKITAMSAANALLKPRFLRDLETIKSTTQRLKDLMVKAPTKVQGADFAQAISIAVKEAELTINKADMSLRTASPTTLDQAQGITSAIEQELSASNKRINDIISTFEKAQNAAQQAAEKVKQEEAAATAQIKCRSCGSMNAAKSSTCGQCGAPF